MGRRGIIQPDLPRADVVAIIYLTKIIQYLSEGTMPKATETNKQKNAVNLHIIEFMLELNISLECLMINGFVSLGKGAQKDTYYTTLSLFFYWTICLAKLEARLRKNSISQGDQSWVFVGRTDVEAETPILWPPDAKS